MTVINKDGVVSGGFMLVINGAALVLNIIVLVNLIINRRSIPPYMWMVYNLVVADLIFAFLGLCPTCCTVYFREMFY